jgi:hypothetical protein
MTHQSHFTLFYYFCTITKFYCFPLLRQMYIYIYIYTSRSISKGEGRLSVSSLRLTQASCRVTIPCQSVCLRVQPHIGLHTSLDSSDTDSKYLIRKKL